CRSGPFARGFRAAEKPCASRQDFSPGDIARTPAHRNIIEWRRGGTSYLSRLPPPLIQKETARMNINDPVGRHAAPLTTPSTLTANAIPDISGALTILLSDMFALYIKTKNFHWHMSGPHFRDYHLLLDEQGEQIFAATDAIAERVRKIGGTTLRSIGQISRLQRLLDNDAAYVTPDDMLAELREDNKQLTAYMRET